MQQNAIGLLVAMPESVAIDVIEPGGVLLDAADVNTTPIPTQGTASIKLIGIAEKAAATELEALEPRAEGVEVRHATSEPI